MRRHLRQAGLASICEVTLKSGRRADIMALSPAGEVWIVDLGKPENLGRLLRQALDRAKICASDPLCAEHNPRTDSSLHAASCHACSFVSETSCECGNRYLDRALVIPTLQTNDAAFFAGI